MIMNIHKLKSSIVIVINKLNCNVKVEVKSLLARLYNIYIYIYKFYNNNCNIIYNKYVYNYILVKSLEILKSERLFELRSSF